MADTPETLESCDKLSRPGLSGVIVRDAVAIITVVAVVLFVFRDNPNDLRRRELRDREHIKKTYDGPGGEPVLDVTVIEPGLYLVTRKAASGGRVQFRVRRSGSNLVYANEESARIARPDRFSDHGRELSDSISQETDYNK